MHSHSVFVRTALIAGLAAAAGTGATAAMADDVKPPFAPFQVGPSIPVTLPLAGSIVDILVQSFLTKNQYSLVLIKDAPGGGPMPMTHTRETETFYVLAGTYRFTVGDKTYDAKPGDVVAAPPGVSRSFKVTSDTQGTLLALYTPGGFENFFLEWGRQGLDTPDKIQALEKQYGIEGSGVGK